MSHILLTGGAGFIGSHTADALLARGHRVRILDNLDPQIHGLSGTFPQYLDPAIECIRADVCDTEAVSLALDGIDAVYHFAAQTGVGQSMYDLRSYTEVNCTGTAALLEAIVKSKRKLQRLVLASSRAVYGEGTHRCATHDLVYPPVRSREQLEAGDFRVHCPLCGKPAQAVCTLENRPLLPVSVYGWTKQQQENLCKYASDTFGTRVIMLRYFNVYGSRQSLSNPYTGVVSIFYSRILSGKPIYLYEQGLPLRDFVHISDVVQANLLALETDCAPGSSFNIGTSEMHTIADIANTLGEACGRTPNIEVTSEFRVGDIFSGIADISRAAVTLGYRPQISLTQGMSEFVSWAAHQESVDLYAKTVQELQSHGLFGRARNV